MLRYIGAICIFIFAFYVVFSYERHQKTLALQGEAFLLLLKFLLDEMRALARPAAECIRAFKAPALEKSAFLRAIENGMPPHEAYRNERESLCLPSGLDEIVDGALESFGRGGRKEECRRLSDAISRAETLIAEEREAHARRLKLCRTLVTSSALGLVILLM